MSSEIASYRPLQRFTKAKVGSGSRELIGTLLGAFDPMCARHVSLRSLFVSFSHLQSPMRKQAICPQPVCRYPIRWRAFISSVNRTIAKRRTNFLKSVVLLRGQWASRNYWTMKRACTSSRNSLRKNSVKKTSNFGLSVRNSKSCQIQMRWVLVFTRRIPFSHVYSYVRFRIEQI